MGTHLISAGGAVIQAPLSYRDEPVDGAEDALPPSAAQEPSVLLLCGRGLVRGRAHRVPPPPADVLAAAS